MSVLSVQAKCPYRWKKRGNLRRLRHYSGFERYSIDLSENTHPIWSLSVYSADDVIGQESGILQNKKRYPSGWLPIKSSTTFCSVAHQIASLRRRGRAAFVRYKNNLSALRWLHFVNSKRRLSLFIICDSMSLTDEVKLAPYAFVTPLGVDKGCYKHTVFWTFNIE